MAFFRALLSVSIVTITLHPMSCLHEEVHLAGGIVEIQLENKPSTGLTIANRILLSIGVVPLVLSFTGLIAITQAPCPQLPNHENHG
jgi:hypothetical protein